MRKALSALLAVLAVMSMAATCKKDERSGPGQWGSTRPPKPMIVAQEVQICVDTAFNTREKDEACKDTSATGCCVVRFLRNDPAWERELPAVKEVVDPGRAFSKPLPGSTPVTIPPEGAVFQR